MTAKPVTKSLIFAGTSAILAIFCFFVLKPKIESKKKKETTKGLIFSDLKREDIKEFEVINEFGTFKLFKDANKTWKVNYLSNDQSVKIIDGDSDTIEGIVSIILSSKIENPFNSTELDKYGLSKPKRILKFSDKNSKIITIEIGQQAPIGYKNYIKVSGQQDLYLTNRSLASTLNKSLEDLVNKKIWDTFSPKNISELTIKTKAKNDSLANLNISLLKKAKTWYSSINSNIKLNQIEVTNFIKLFNQTRVNEVINSDNKLNSSNTVANFSFRDLKNKLSKYNLLKLNNKWMVTNQNYQPIAEVSNAFIELFKKSPQDFYEKRLTNKNQFDLVKIHINKSLTYTKKGQNWIKAESNEKLGQEKITKLIDPIFNSQVSSFQVNQSPSLDGQVFIKLEFSKNQFEELIIIPGANGKTLVKSNYLDRWVEFPIDFSAIDLKNHKKTNSSIDNQNPRANKKGMNILQATVSDKSQIVKLDAPNLDESKNYQADVTVKGKGTISIKFFYNDAPYTVSNFVHLARNGFYNGVNFHRVISDFVIQGGDPSGNGTGGPGYKFHDEQNSHTHKRGALSMANAGPNTNGSQFFIVLAGPQSHLDGKHTVFGEVSSGLDVVDQVVPGDIMEKVEVHEVQL